MPTDQTKFTSREVRFAAVASIAIAWLALAVLPFAWPPFRPVVPLLAASAALITAFGLWTVSRVNRACPRPGVTHILFEDLSAGGAQRLDRNRLLAQSVINQLQNAQPLQTFDLQVDVMPGIEEAGFGGLQPVLTMSSVLDYERTDHRITIGAIEFSLRDLLSLINGFFSRPPAQYLEGWLIEHDGVVEVGAHVLDHRRRPEPRPARTRTVHAVNQNAPASAVCLDAAPSLAWVVRGTHGRDRAIADLAAQILVDMGRSTLSSDWRSLRSFHEAMALRDDRRLHTSTDAATTVQARLSMARSHLAESVSYDASNWIARFSLAVTLCRDNEPQLALEHLEILERAVARGWEAIPHEWFATPKQRRTWPPAGTHAEDTFGPGFNELVRHLALLPECAFLVLFNKGVAHATQKNNPDSLYEARKIFRQPSQWMPSQSTCAATEGAAADDFAYPYNGIEHQVDAQRRATLALYAMGAYATLIADTDDSTPGTGLESDPVGALEQLLERIGEDCHIHDAVHWPSALAARAIACAALGHVQFRRRKFTDAQTRFEEALAAEPRLVRALLGLAETHVERAKAAGGDAFCNRDVVHDRLARANALLDRAMAINAGCAQGKRLRREIRDYGYRSVIGEPA